MSRSRLQSRFRPTLECLEGRLAPAVNVALTGGSLLITGVPAAGPTEALQVQGLGEDLYQVLDGTIDHGTYRVSGDIRLRLDSVNNDVFIDLAGDTLPGSLLVDLGRGDRDLASFNAVYLTNTWGVGRVARDVSLSGGSGGEYFNIFGIPEFDAFLEIGGNVQVSSAPVVTPYEDTFRLDPGVTIEGSVTSFRLTHTLISGATILGNLTVDAGTTPTGLDLLMDGTVRGAVGVTGGATSPAFSSSVLLTGSVAGSVNVQLTTGAATVTHLGTIGRSFMLNASDRVSAAVELRGPIAGSALVNLGGSATTTSRLTLATSLGGSAHISSRSGQVDVTIGHDPGDGSLHPVTLGDNLVVNLGGGSNHFTFNGIVGVRGNGNFSYLGGRGSDIVEIAGVRARNIRISTGGGDDTVQFTGFARGSRAVIDFGPGAGARTWVPPVIIELAITLVNYP